MHHPVIGQPINYLHQREFVNKTSICSIICVIRSKYNAVMSYYEVNMGYSGLIWVIPGYYGVLSYRYKVGPPLPCGIIIYLTNLYTEHCAACSNQTQTARVYQNADSSLSKHEDLTQSCFNVGPAPLGKYWNSIGSIPRVCWAPHRCPSTPTPPPP